jgi:peroxiredoxin
MRSWKMVSTGLFMGLILMTSYHACVVYASALGRTAPDFTLKSSAGANIKLSELRGQVVMLNFWASWCGPCRQEIPDMDALYRSYEKLGFRTLGINLDEDKGRAEALARELGVSYPILYDDHKTVSTLYQVDAMPTTVIIDRDGRIRYVHRGYRDGYIQRYQEEVRGLLRE